MSNLAIALSPARMNAAAQLAAALVIFWPVWHWYCLRTCDRSDEPLGILALLTLIAIIGRRLSGSHLSEPDAPLSQALSARTMALTCGLLAAYCCSLACAPPAVSAILALIAIVYFLTNTSKMRQFSAGECALLTLSLPLVASLNFYAGYPLRLLACDLASILLNLGGLAVHTRGTEILSSASVVGIDPPCSGIKMLWMSIYIAATLSGIRQLRLFPTLRMLFLSVLVAIGANAVRVSSLFYLESGIITVQEPWHQLLHTGIGASSFAASVLILMKASLSIPTQEPRLTVSRNQKENGAETPKHQFLLTIALVLSCTLAALEPFFLTIPPTPVLDSEDFLSWPSTFEGQRITQVPMSELNQKYADNFPGKIAVFRTGKSRIVFRWVTIATRQLHSSETCYRAGGYKITWLPEYIDSSKVKWSVFEAINENERLRVRERVFDSSGQNWTDLSSWYWAALLNQSKSPWWVVSEIQSLATPN